MADLLVCDADDAVVRRLKARAKAAGVALDTVTARILRRDAVMPDTETATDAITAELAAMRATQSPQDGDAAADIRALRDGGMPPDAASQAA